MPNATSAFDFVEKMNFDIRYKWVLMNCYTYHSGGNKQPKSFEEVQRWYQDLLKQYPDNCLPVINYINSRISQIFRKGVGVRDPLYLTEPPHEPQLELVI